jgi:hypothetical protein
MEQKYWLIQIERKHKAAGELFPWQYLADIDPIDWFINWCDIHPPAIQWTLIRYFELTEAQYSKLKTKL